MDSRDTKFFQWYLELNTQRMTATVSVNMDGETREVDFKYIICPVCRGRGNYVNPNIDRHGLSREDMMEWEPEEIQDYVNGEYNVPCGYCNGYAVVPHTNDLEVNREIQDYEDSMAEWQAEMDMESRMMGEY